VGLVSSSNFAVRLEIRDLRNGLHLDQFLPRPAVVIFRGNLFFHSYQCPGRRSAKPDYARIAKDYEQVSARLSLVPSFIDPAPPAFEDRRRSKDFFYFLRSDGTLGDMLDTVEGPFEIVDSHALSAKAGA